MVSVSFPMLKLEVSDCFLTLELAFPCAWILCMCIELRMFFLCFLFVMKWVVVPNIGAANWEYDMGAR